MRNKRARQIRNQVFEDMGYVPTVEEPLKSVLRYPEFRKIFRAAKKNYHVNSNKQTPLFPAPRIQKDPIPSKELTKKGNYYHRKRINKMLPRLKKQEAALKAKKEKTAA